MAKKIYVGNLPWSTTSASLEALFSAHGPVSSAEVVTDRETGRSRGFGFVEMATDEGFQAAVAELNGTEVDGRAITVNEARSAAPARADRAAMADRAAAGGTTSLPPGVSRACRPIDPTRAAEWLAVCRHKAGWGSVLAGDG